MRIGNLSVEVRQGDLTKQAADAICNPASSMMFMGGGAAGALRRAGGAEIEREALRQAPVPVGKAVLTTAGRLPAKWVVHAPTMERPAMRTSSQKVYLATRAALDCAEAAGAKSIVIPGIGTGVGEVSTDDAARAMIRAIKEFSKRTGSLKEIVLCDIDENMVESWKRELSA